MTEEVCCQIKEAFSCIENYQSSGDPNSLLKAIQNYQSVIESYDKLVTDAARSIEGMKTLWPLEKEISNCYQGWIYQRRRLKTTKSIFEKEKIQKLINTYKSKLRYLQTS